MIKHLTVLICLGTLLCGGARAQYYDWGQGPASERWRNIKTPEIRYIFPKEFERQAVKLMQYLDTIRPHVAHGFTHGPMPGMPLIVRAQNFNSNGIVMLAPKRMELIVTPPAGMPAFPWFKQLAAHEYRHAVQFNNLNRGIIRVLSRILGQQGSLIGLGFMPVWAMEGDAVLAETQMSSFGRGLQPSFTIEYRAMALEGGGGEFPIDKYFCGSFRDFMPDHYQLGYQLTGWAENRYGENIWDKVVRFNVRNAYLIFPTPVALRKFYGTSVNELFTRTFEDLGAHWRSLPDEPNSARIINTPVTSYTWYNTPYMLDDRRLVAIKRDLDREARLVEVDVATGAERVLARIGSVSSGIEVADGKIWWTEFRQSTFWEQRVNSQLCSFDMATGRKTVHGRRQALFPTALPDGSVATVRYNREGSYTIESGKSQWNIPDTVSVHGLAYEQATDKLYFIGLSDGGMWIGSVAGGESGFRQVTRAGYTAISGLSAGAGRLYFSSIASGRDEAHLYDLAQGKEYRISASRYGSFAPSEAGDDGVVMTTYTPQGYLLSTQRTDSLTEVPYSLLPQNVVNPPLRDWNVVNLDRFTASGETSLPVRKYRRGLHLFNFHSWTPFYFEPDRLVSESHFEVRAGATVMSQNHLNTAFTQLGYAWTGQHSLLRGKFSYLGWAPKFELKAEWSDRPQNIVGVNPGVPPPSPGDFFELTARTYLPLLLSSGSMFRSLTPVVEYQFNNAKIYSPSNKRYEQNLHKMIFTLQYTENARLAHRDFLPRIGYAARMRYTSNPFSDDFGKIWSFYGRTFLPGMAPHHSLLLQGLYQSQRTDGYAFSQKELFPRGADFNFTPQRYAAFSGDYQFPVWYPDGGINSVIYFRRVRLNLGGDFARYKNFANNRVPKPEWQNVWSYGGDITFDIVPFRLPSNTSTSLTFSIRKPSDSKKAVVGFSISMPI